MDDLEGIDSHLESDDLPTLRANLEKILKLQGWNVLTPRRFVELSHNSDPQVRFYAAAILGHFPEPDVTRSLIQLIDDDSPAVRMQAEKSLTMHGQSAVTPLIEALTASDTRAKVRKAALELAAKLGAYERISAAVPELLLVGGPSLANRAIEIVLKHSNDTRLVQILVERLKNAEGDAKLELVRVLGKLQYEEVIEPVLSCSDDENVAIRLAVMEAVSGVKHPLVAQFLIRSVGDSDLTIQHAAIEAIGNQGIATAHVTLINALGSRDLTTQIKILSALDTLQALSQALIVQVFRPVISTDGITTQVIDQLTAFMDAISLSYHDKLTTLVKIFEDQPDELWRSIVSQIRTQGEISFYAPGLDERTDNATHFAAYHARDVEAEMRNGLYIYAYYSDVVDEIHRDVRKFTSEFGGTIPHPRMVTARTLTTGTPITVVPACPDVVFNPVSLTKTFDGKWTRFDFDFNVARSSDDLRVGEISIQVNAIEIASIKFVIDVVQTRTESQELATSNSLASAKLTNEQSTMYQKVFVSYSRKDKRVVELYRFAQLALGNELFVDTYSLRAGENWMAALARAIDSADVFQLFWSDNSSHSEYCQYEWEYALLHKCPDTKCAGFIRPVYWSQPLPSPPEALQHLNFKYVPIQIPLPETQQ